MTALRRKPQDSEGAGFFEEILRRFRGSAALQWEKEVRTRPTAPPGGAGCAPKYSRRPDEGGLMARVKLKFKLAGKTALELQHLLEAGADELAPALTEAILDALEKGELDISIKAKAPKKAEKDEKAGKAEKKEVEKKAEKAEKAEKPAKADASEKAPAPAKKPAAPKAAKAPKAPKSEKAEKPVKAKAPAKAPAEAAAAPKASAAKAAVKPAAKPAAEAKPKTAKAAGTAKRAKPVPKS